MFGFQRLKNPYETELTELSMMTHGNFLRKTEDYFKFIGSCFTTGDEAIEQLLAIARNSNENKTVFLTTATLCLLRNKDNDQLIESYQIKYGREYLIALELSLAIFLRSLNSPRGGDSQQQISTIKKQLVANINTSLALLRKRNELNNTIPAFVKRLFKVARHKTLQEEMTIAMVLDDLNPLRTATLTKMMFDVIAVLLEYTRHNIVIICSRLHAPGNQFWMPGVHQTKILPLDEYVKHYDLPMAESKSRLSVINLNEIFYTNNISEQIEIDVVVTYPFRHGILEPALYAIAPVVETEIMSGLSTVSNCDLVIPNGVPSESFLKSNIAKTALTQPPIRKFKGGASSDFKYLNESTKFVVSASKDFDKRAELDIGLFLDYVASFLEAHDDFSWIFVGGSREFQAMLSAQHMNLVDAKKVIHVDYEQDLPGLLSHAYLYVQPPIVGGGRLPLIAIENGCAVITFQFGDCTMYIPYTCQFENFDALFKEVSEVAKNEQRRTELLDACADVFVSTVNMEAATSFEAVLRRAQIKFIGRTV